MSYPMHAMLASKILSRATPITPTGPLVSLGRLHWVISSWHCLPTRATLQAPFQIKVFSLISPASWMSLTNGNLYLPTLAPLPSKYIIPALLLSTCSPDRVPRPALRATGAGIPVVATRYLSTFGYARFWRLVLSQDVRDHLLRLIAAARSK